MVVICTNASDDGHEYRHIFAYTGEHFTRAEKHNLSPMVRTEAVVGQNFRIDLVMVRTEVAVGTMVTDGTSGQTHRGVMRHIVTYAPIVGCMVDGWTEVVVGMAIVVCGGAEM